MSHHLPFISVLPAPWSTCCSELCTLLVLFSHLENSSQRYPHSRPPISFRLNVTTSEKPMIPTPFASIVYFFRLFVLRLLCWLAAGPKSSLWPQESRTWFSALNMYYYLVLTATLQDRCCSYPVLQTGKANHREAK